MQSGHNEYLIVNLGQFFIKITLPSVIGHFRLIYSGYFLCCFAQTLPQSVTKQMLLSLWLCLPVDLVSLDSGSHLESSGVVDAPRFYFPRSRKTLMISVGINRSFLCDPSKSSIRYEFNLCHLAIIDSRSKKLKIKTVTKVQKHSF